MTLSPREREVVKLLGKDDDRTYTEVALVLGISVPTVRTYVTRIMHRYPSKKRPRAALRDLYRSVIASADSGFDD